MNALRSILSGRMLVAFLMGFSSGMPLLLTGSTLKAWMTEEKVDLTLIGAFSLVGLPYTTKFLWSPILDSIIPPFLGRRRGWLLIMQGFLALAIAALGFSEPAISPWTVAGVALVVAFFSASQDIVIDAYRRESLSDQELGMGSSLYIYGYRVAILVAGAGALVLATWMPWKAVYFVMAGILGVGIVTTLICKEPVTDVPPPRNLKEAVVEPFLEYFKRHGAWIMLAFILLYKIGDNMAGEMAMPFYLQQGFTKIEVASIVKGFGLFATLLGAFLGGLGLLHFGIRRCLWVFGFLQAASTLGFAVLAVSGHSLLVLSGVIAFENLTSGMGSSAFVAFMASLTHKRFTATQYALLTSLMGVPRVIASAPTGYLAKTMGWAPFFCLCAIVAIPGMLLLLKFKKDEKYEKYKDAT